jgi:hypothetical protein
LISDQTEKVVFVFALTIVLLGSMNLPKRRKGEKKTKYGIRYPDSGYWP